MPANQRVRATFTGVVPLRGEGGSGVLLSFRPVYARIDVERIDDFAYLGPDLELPAVDGLGKVFRILRAARIAVPGKPMDWVDRERELTAFLERAVGTNLLLQLRPRSRMRFTAWTESGVETVEDVIDVLEAPDAYLVIRRRGRYPVRIPRSSVVRQHTECERWYEVLDIERA
ncbi:MAG: hypothetical protein O7A09_02060 [Proteobacteria bacterium]|nr:hypothetical protein [Pseudomonadota bacterium]